MKKFICALCSLAIVITYMTGCGKSSDNPFASDNAIKGQVGNLYYTVPENAVLNSSTDDSAMYDVSISNSTEKYVLTIMCKHTGSNDEYKDMLQNIDNMKNQSETGTGATYTAEDINDFLGQTVDKGCKCVAENNGQRFVTIVAAKSKTLYMIGYTVKTGFYDQSVWDNFYAQLKLV